MAISWKDKNRNAAAGSHESEWRDDDANELKRAVDELLGIVTGSATVVKSKSDFPAAVNDVITLDPGVSYRITGAVSLGNCRLVTNGANLVGLSLFSDSLTYTGTEAMITCTNANLDCKNLTLNASNGTLVDVDGTSSHRVLFNSILANADQFGDINGVNVFEFSQGAISVTTNGMTFSGTPTALILNATGFSGLSGSGTYIDFGTAVFGFGGEIDVVRASLAAGETFISGLAAGANFGVGLTMQGGFFAVSGGQVLNGIDVNDLKVRFNDNAGLEDSNHAAEMYIADGDEVVTTISGGDGDAGNPKLVSGNWTESFAQRFTTDPSGAITYHNGTTNDRFGMAANFNADPASGNNVQYNFYIAIQGVVDLASRSYVEVSSNNAKHVTVFTDKPVGDGERVEIFVECLSGTTNVTISSATFLVKE